MESTASCTQPILYAPNLRWFFCGGEDRTQNIDSSTAAVLIDVGRHNNLTVLTVREPLGSLFCEPGPIHCASFRGQPHLSSSSCTMHRQTLIIEKSIDLAGLETPGAFS